MSDLRTHIDQLLISLGCPMLYEGYGYPGQTAGAIHLDVEALRWLLLTDHDPPSLGEPNDGHRTKVLPL